MHAIIDKFGHNNTRNRNLNKNSVVIIIRGRLKIMYNY